MHRFLWVVAGAAFAAVPSARAATAPAATPPPSARAAPSDFARRGTLTGLVQGIDILHGRAQLDVSGTPVIIRGMPVQFMRLQKGVLLSVEYNVYGDQYWIPFAGTGGSGRFASMRPESMGLVARTETVTGAVERLDKAHGILVVRGLLLHAHPEALAGVVPGSFVELTFRQLLGVRWVAPGDQAGGGIRPVPRRD